MANDIDMWQDICRQEGFIRWLKKEIKRGIKCQDTLARAKQDYKKMIKEFNDKYINN